MEKYDGFIQFEVDALMNNEEDELWVREGVFKSDEESFCTISSNQRKDLREHVTTF